MPRLLLVMMLMTGFSGALLSQRQEYTGKVVAVADGDTFTLLRGREQVRVRLEGIDCPEKGQPFGNNARTALSDMVFGKEVRIAQTDVDRYGRVIARVFLSDGRNVNQELLRRGLAWHYTRYSKDEEYARLEAAARKNRAGLWADTRPIAPWDWRKGQR
jgi:micrococcal nuclease